MPFFEKDRSTGLTEVALVKVGGCRLLLLDSFKRPSGQHHLASHLVRTYWEPKTKDLNGGQQNPLNFNFGTASLSQPQSISVPQPTSGSSLPSPSLFFANPSQKRHLCHRDLILLHHRHTHPRDLALPVFVVVSLLVSSSFRPHHLRHRMQTALSVAPSAVSAVLVY